MLNVRPTNLREDSVNFKYKHDILQLRLANNPAKRTNGGVERDQRSTDLEAYAAEHSVIGRPNLR